MRQVMSPSIFRLSLHYTSLLTSVFYFLLSKLSSHSQFTGIPPTLHLRRSRRPAGLSESENPDSEVRTSPYLEDPSTNLEATPTFESSLLPPPHQDMDPATLARIHELVDSMNSILSNKVTKLTGTNYHRWKLEMEMRLIGTGAWYLITEARPDPLPEERRQQEALLLTDLFDSCEPDQQDLIIECTNPKQAWATL